MAKFPISFLLFISCFIPKTLYAQTAEALCEKAYEASKALQQTEATLQATIQSGIGQTAEELKTEHCTSKFTLTLNPSSKFSLYQFYSETWQGNKRISGIYFGEGHLIRFLETDSQVTDQTFQGR